MIRRKFRALAALFAIVAVLFSQLAVSAYACPGADGMMLAAIVDEAPPCDQHPAKESTTPLCVAHCQQGDQSLDQRGAPVPAVALAMLPTSWLAPVATVVESPTASATLVSLLERPTGPPLAVRHCRFNI